MNLPEIIVHVFFKGTIKLQNQEIKCNHCNTYKQAARMGLVCLLMKCYILEDLESSTRHK